MPTPASGRRTTHIRDLNLDEAALEPGQVLDMRSERELSGLPAAAPRSERPDLPPGIPLAVAQIGRRISPLVSGRRAMPRAGLAVVEDGGGRIPPVSAAVNELPAARPAPVRVVAPIPVAVKSAKSRNTLGSLVVQLGRFGDIINILSLLAEEARILKRPIRLMVAEEFASVLDGVSYVKPVIFKGQYGELDRAWKVALAMDADARCTQVYTPERDFPRKEDSFARDSWRRIGATGRWEQTPLYFDRRDRAREEALAAEIDWSKPVVLVNLAAASYPFPHSERVWSELTTHASKENYQLVDLSIIRAERLYDLLGLFDRAALLISVDTATQHLANASSIPVIAFRVSEPWFASPRRANHLLNRRYSDIDMREVTNAVMSVIKPRLAEKIVHVYPERAFNDDRSSPRIALAQTTWNSDLITNFPAPEVTMKRNSKDTLGDPIATSYMLDIFNSALPELKEPEDILIFTNDDVGFSDTALTDIRRACGLRGACFGYRFDHGKIEWPLDHFETVSAPCNGGIDVFAFNRRWIVAHGKEFPDMLLGRTGWDLVFRNIIRKTGGMEVVGAIWHEDHVSWWKQNFDTPGNKYNTEHLKKYRDMNDVTRPYDR